MGFITEYTILDVLLVFVVLVLLLFHYIVRTYGLWDSLGVKGPTPKFPLGNVGDVILKRRKGMEFWTQVYNRMKRKRRKFEGYFILVKPVLMVADPELLKHIMTRDFEYFHDRGTYSNEKGDPLTAHLVNLKGEKWKNLRSNLTPTFSSGKVKNMFQILSNVTEELDRCIDQLVEANEDLDIKHVLGRYTIDIIGNCAFGIDCNSLRDPNAQFYTHSRQMFQIKLSRVLKNMVARICPTLLRITGIKMYQKEAIAFYMGIVREVIELRKKNDIKRNDFMQLLIDLMNNKDEEALTFNEVCAQAFVFFLAGYETTATATTFTLYELAANQDIQDKLREEIEDTKSKFGGLNYDSLWDMPYLDKVISESLRKYPPFPFTVRECTKEYVIPGTEIKLPVGVKIIIPIFPIHRDPEHYQNPDIFDPERFSDVNKRKRHQYAYIPFGEGPRHCIGTRFALIVVKVAIAHLVSRYRFRVSPNTKLPMEFDEKNLSLSTTEKIWLNVEKINVE